MPYEAVWKAFLESVPNFGGQGDSWQLLFNVYVHPPPNVVLHESSIFVNYQLPQRAEVQWGQWSVVSNPTPLHLIEDQNIMGLSAGRPGYVQRNEMECTALFMTA